MNKKVNDYIADNRYETEDEIQVKIWSMLENAILNRKSDFRTPIFISSNNDEPDGRVVVLRGADKNQCSLSFHSDYRSNKVNLIKKNSKGALVFYDKKEKIQLRIKVECSINFKNNISKKAWEKTQQISRKCYLASFSTKTFLLILDSMRSFNGRPFKQVVFEFLRRLVFADSEPGVPIPRP